VPGRTLAIGDIHGCDVALHALLPMLDLRSEDTVVVLGDAVDRGPATRQVVERLLELAQECQFVFVLGNHEQMMLESLSGGTGVAAWLRYGGAATLQSYGGDPREIPRAHVEFLSAAVDFHETESTLFVHANLDPQAPLDRQDPEWLRWTHLSGHEAPHPSGKRIVCGHTPQKNGLPLAIPGWICIDTFAWGKGWLTCLDVGTDEWYQANQAGATRSGRLE
jgi:serine/threonine protein phosphatase 1